MKKHLKFLIFFFLLPALFMFNSCDSGSATLQTIPDDSTGLSVSLGKNTSLSELPAEFEANLLIKNVNTGENIVEGVFTVFNNQIFSELLVPEATLVYIEITADINAVPLKGTAETIIEAGSEGIELSITMTTDIPAIISSTPWSFDYNWECNNVSNRVTVMFAPDFTFTTSEGESGTWTLSNTDLTMNFSNNTVYNGFYSLGFIEGSMTDYNGRTGCFTAFQQAEGGGEGKPDLNNELFTMSGE